MNKQLIGVYLLGAAVLLMKFGALGALGATGRLKGILTVLVLSVFFILAIVMFFTRKKS